MAFCTGCGAPLPEGARFCTNCGKMIAVNKKAEEKEEPVFEAEDAVFEAEEAEQTGAVSEAGADLEAEAEPEFEAEEPESEKVGTAGEEAAASSAPGSVPEPVKADPAAAVGAIVPETLAPLSTSAFFWEIFLCALPCFVGLILTIVWACGGAKNPNRRNLARALLIFRLIGIVLLIAVGIVLLIFGIANVPWVFSMIMD